MKLFIPKADRDQKKYVNYLWGSAIGIAFGVLLAPYVLAWTFLHPPRRFHRRNPLSGNNLKFERIRLVANDGMPISGWYVPAPASEMVRGVIVLCHGYWGHRGNMLPHLNFLHAAGYHAVLFDFRAHGWSGGHRVSFGVHETQDLRATIDWVKRQPHLAQLPLGVVSESMGAAVALLLAADDSRIEAVVSDSAFSRFDRAIETRLSSLFGVTFARYSANSVKTTGERILRKAATEIAPVEAIGKIAPRPILLMHGLSDQVIPPACLTELAAAANPIHTEIWTIPGAQHVWSIYHAPEEYKNRVLNFLDRSLPMPPS